MKERLQKSLEGALAGLMSEAGDNDELPVIHLEVARKNGKTTFLAGIGLYMLVGDGEPGAEVFTAATKKDQARIMHEEALRMVRKSPDLSAALDTYRTNISDPLTESKYEPLGADSKPMDGLKAEDLSPSEFFMLSRIDGTWDIKSIIQIAPLRESDALRTLKRLRENGLIELKDP